MLPEESIAKFISFKTDHVELLPYRKGKTGRKPVENLVHAWLTCNKIKSNFHLSADDRVLSFTSFSVFVSDPG